MNLKDALETIKNECSKHKSCSGCPLFTDDPMFGNEYCSVTREGDVPAEWNVNNMIN